MTSRNMSTQSSLVNYLDNHLTRNFVAQIHDLAASDLPAKQSLAPYNSSGKMSRWPTIMVKRRKETKNIKDDPSRLGNIYKSQ
jgi:hypothetical protein